MILVTGAAGLTGSQVIRQLSDRHVPARALVRDPSRASALARENAQRPSFRLSWAWRQAAL